MVRCPECNEQFEELNENFIVHRWEAHNLDLADQIKKGFDS